MARHFNLIFFAMSWLRKWSRFINRRVYLFARRVPNARSAVERGNLTNREAS